MDGASGFKSKSGAWKKNWKSAMVLERDLWRFSFIVLLLILLCWLSQDLKIKDMFFNPIHGNVEKNIGNVVALNDTDRDIFQKEELIWQDKNILKIKEYFSDDFFNDVFVLGKYSEELDNYTKTIGDNEQIVIRLPKRYENAVNVAKGGVDVSIFPLTVNTQNSEASIDNERLIYDEVYPNVAVIREMKSDGWKEYLLIKNEQASKTFDFHVVVNNGYLEFDNGVIGVSNLNGKELMKFRNLQSWNVEGDSINNLVKYDLQNNGILEIKIEYDAKLKYPLLIDPGIKI